MATLQSPRDLDGTTDSSKQEGAVVDQVESHELDHGILPGTVLAEWLRQETITRQEARMKKLGAVVASLALVSLLGVTDAAAQTQTKAADPMKQTEPKPKAGQPLQSAKRFAEHTGLVRASTVIGNDVKDASGKDAGKVEDLMVDSRGDVVYAILSFGGFLGVGDKLYAVPWNAMMIDRDKKAVFLDVRKETLERAPSFPKDKWTIGPPDFHDRGWGDDVHKYWSDASITAAVKSKLAAEKASTLIKVDVDTDHGVVQLNGTVDSMRTKQRASDLARRIEGVRKVVNNLKVQG